MLLVLLLSALAMIAAVAWIAEHLIVFAGVALLIWGVFYLGRHERTRAVTVGSDVLAFANRAASGDERCGHRGRRSAAGGRFADRCAVGVWRDWR
jgi:hypothetical protein